MLRSVSGVIAGVLVMWLVVAGIEFASHLPVWMSTLGLLLPVPAALLAARLARPRVPPLRKTA